MNKKDRIAAFILGIDFTPNYEDWWNKPDLTKEELIWLMVGISPQDMSHYRTLEGKTDKTPDEEKWCQNFFNYFDNKHLFWRYGSNRHQEYEQCAISWDNKKQFIQDAYNAFITIDDGFLDYLESKGDFQKNPDLEKYKGWRQYQLDLKNADFDWKINTEEEAFAVFLGLLPESFKRYYALKLKKENRNKRLPFYLWLNELSPDDTWFFLLYQKFLRDTLPVSDTLIDDLKRLNLWPKVSEFVKPWVNSNFSNYVKALHNQGAVFSRSFMKAFKKHVLPDWDWQYEAGSRVWKEYQHWVNKEKVWTFEQAIFLFTGKNPPRQKGNYGEEITVYLTDYDLKIEYSAYEKRYVITAFEPDEYRDSGLKLFDIKERLENHVLSGDITGCDKENTKFKAKDIYKWLRENTVHQPPLALHLAVEESLKSYLGMEDSRVSGDKEENFTISDSPIELDKITRHRREEILLEHAQKIKKKDPNLKLKLIHQQIKASNNYQVKPVIKNRKSESEQEALGRQWKTFLKPITQDAIDYGIINRKKS
jgi:hypothetical protein